MAKSFGLLIGLYHVGRALSPKNSAKMRKFVMVENARWFGETAGASLCERRFALKLLLNAPF
jgi:hypothetical protein